MRLLDRFFTRRHEKHRFSALPSRVRKRLAFACEELTEAEVEIAERLQLPQPPRLLIVDEEEAVILSPSDRATLG